MSTTTGTMKFYDPKKAYGFIRPDDKSAEDAFFHISALAPGFVPAENQRVTYVVGTGRDGRSMDIARC